MVTPLHCLARRPTTTISNECFRSLLRIAPSLIVLEDIDRAFPQVPSQLAPTKVSLSHLLNCLDGLGTQEGVVVVATANDPTTLDPAILQRPGRFDRVVEFPAPDRWTTRHLFPQICFESERTRSFKILSTTLRGSFVRPAAGGVYSCRPARIRTRWGGVRPSS